ncbi:MAG: class I SAM-dependent RNA methyltransferase [Proteobacteria bacterium]|nr:class I SAM-dependent RNA methyltransferase [Pseudomonadota bacterium]
MTERVHIEAIGQRGDGVTGVGEEAIYVAYTLPGEIVEVDAWPGHPDRRHLARVAAPSRERVAPVCKHFGVCGGCALQHWRGEPYRAWKRGLVVSALARARIAAPVADLIDAHGQGRRRAVLHARRGTHDVLHVGFAAPHAHHIVAIDRCPILAPALAPAIAIAWAIAEILDPARKPLDIHATATDDGIDVDIRGSGALRPGQIAALAALAEARGLARLTRHGELVAQRVAPTITCGPARVRLPPGAFLQATAAGEAALASAVAQAVGDARKVADLFCGIGPLALRLARNAQVTAVDADADAVEALRQAAATTSGLKPIAAMRRDLFRRPLLAGELDGLDAVLFDPPRQGAEAQVRAIAVSSVPLVVAISCNPATFARDAAILVAGGYRAQTVTPIDQFRYCAHVEIVAAFRR